VCSQRSPRAGRERGRREGGGRESNAKEGEKCERRKKKRASSTTSKRAIRAKERVSASAFSVCGSRFRLHGRRGGRTSSRCRCSARFSRSFSPAAPTMPCALALDGLRGAAPAPPAIPPPPATPPCPAPTTTGDDSCRAGGAARRVPAVRVAHAHLSHTSAAPPEPRRTAQDDLRRTTSDSDGLANPRRETIAGGAGPRGSQRARESVRCPMSGLAQLHGWREREAPDLVTQCW
jgi:hypothetical protein